MQTCVECGQTFHPGEGEVQWKEGRVATFLEKRCALCEGERLEKLGAPCANCGGPIFPQSQVSVLLGPDGQRQVAHSTFECSPAGGAFYGYWGEGELVASFERIEQC